MSVDRKEILLSSLSSLKSSDPSPLYYMDGIKRPGMIVDREEIWLSSLSAKIPRPSTLGHCVPSKPSRHRIVIVTERGNDQGTYFQAMSRE